MSVGADLVTIAKDANDLYKTAKRISKELADEASIAKSDLNMLKSCADSLADVLSDLPTDMERNDRKRFISATKAIIQERLKHQGTVTDFEERLKLNAQLFTLENQELKLDLLDHFDVGDLLDETAVEKLRLEVEDAQKQIRKQIKARGYVRLASKLAILVIDFGVLVAKAAT